VTRALQGVVLRTIHVARDFIANTTTTTGLNFLNDFPVRFNNLLPELNYTILH
jgi:hypothetical protein